MDDYEVAADQVGTTNNSEVRLIVVPYVYPLCWRPIPSERIDPVTDHRHTERVGIRFQVPPNRPVKENRPRFRLGQWPYSSSRSRRSGCSAT